MNGQRYDFKSKVRHAFLAIDKRPLQHKAFHLENPNRGWMLYRYGEHCEETKLTFSTTHSMYKSGLEK